jgi:inorganic pyrophosphatase
MTAIDRLGSGVVSADLHAFVEIPKGSRNKYEWDPELRAIKLDRFLFSSVVYPTDYGFIPETIAGDGDPLDAAICVSEPTFPGCVIAVNAIGLLDMRDEKGEDEKVLCVPRHDPNWSTIERLEDLSDQLRSEIANFFSIYKQLESDKVEVLGWRPRDLAYEAIERARARWSEQPRPA